MLFIILFEQGKTHIKHFHKSACVPGLAPHFIMSAINKTKYKTYTIIYLEFLKKKLGGSRKSSYTGNNQINPTAKEHFKLSLSQPLKTILDLILLFVLASFEEGHHVGQSLALPHTRTHQIEAEQIQN